MDFALILRLMPGLIALLGDPAIKNVLAQIGQTTFPGVDPAKAPVAAVAFFDTNATKWVQTGLNMLGSKLVVNGDTDTPTKDAVRAFQTKNSLTVDGWAGELTQAKLREVIKDYQTP